MKITLADHYGMCFGVRDALAVAERSAAAGPITVLGEIVHNSLVTAKLEARGAREGKLEQLESAPTRHVLITAHGASDERRQAWKNGGFEVTDTTCPLVRRAHARLAALVTAGYFPVVIGMMDHAEVRGLTGDFPGAVVVGDEADVAALPPCSRYGVIAQTTQPIARVRGLVECIRAARPGSEVQFCDTVCQPTKDRQTALTRLLAQVEVVLVVGGHGSNNTRQLRIAAEAAGRRAYQVERAEEIDPHWFIGVQSVGITAGTSTLPETVRQVQTRMAAIAAELPVLG